VLINSHPKGIVIKYRLILTSVFMIVKNTLYKLKYRVSLYIVNLFIEKIKALIKIRAFRKN